MAVCHGQALSIPATQAESEELVAETASMLTLEGEYAAGLDFGGINTSVVSCGLRGFFIERCVLMQSQSSSHQPLGVMACKLHNGATLGPCRVADLQRCASCGCCEATGNLPNTKIRTSVLLHRQAQVAIRRAARGGLLSGPQLVAVSSVLRGGGRLRATVSAVAGQAVREGRPAEVLGPLSATVKVGLSRRCYEPVSPAL